ncbi:hypothetical protein SH668x_000216 [Planctomicrobium sp. SH668]|uniref:hypothetical protein n=1 Tax=Planctomicrobium sp. SH668 TaxID=3448126 RepID=UPI003F5B118A
MTQSRFCVLLVCSLAIHIGCTKPPDSRFEPTYEVTGTVRYGGKEIKDGVIQFTAEKDIANGSEGFSRIRDGNYQASVTVGKKKVIVTSSVPTGASLDSGLPLYRELIPARFNTNSTIEAEISESSLNHDFDLK